MTASAKTRKLPTVYPVKHPVHEYADVVGPLIASCKPDNNTLAAAKKALKSVNAASYKTNYAKMLEIFPGDHFAPQTPERESWAHSLTHMREMKRRFDKQISLLTAQEG